MQEEKKGAKNDRGGKGGEKRQNNNKKSSEPKYSDTDEAKAQLEKIRRIEADMKEVQQKLGQLHSKGKEIDRRVKYTLKDKNKAEERVEGLLRRIEKLKVEKESLSTGLKSHMDLVEQRRVAEAKAKKDLLRQRKKNQTDEEFVNSCLAAIESRVDELNRELESSSGSVADERRILKEMQRVRATKTQIPLYLQRSKAFQEARLQMKRAERDVESKQSFIQTLEDELAGLRAEIAALDGKETTEQKPEKDALSSEEQQLTDKLNGLYAQLRSTKDGLNENREKWYEARRAKKKAAIEKAEQRREEEFARREAERKLIAAEKRNEKKNAIPYAKEIRDCGSLLAYLDGLIKPAGDDNKSSSNNVKPAARSGPPAEEDDWGAFAVQKKKKGKGGKKKAKFTINLQSMDQFVRLGFPAPLSLEEVPGLREKVAAKLAEFKEKSEKEHAATLAEIAAEEAEEARQEKERADAKAKAAAAAPAKAEEEEKKEETEEKKE